MYHISAIIATLLPLSVLSSNGWTDIVIAEGKDVCIDYNYERDEPALFELQVGHRNPFYKYGLVITDNLTPSQQKRFVIGASHSYLDGLMLIQVNISNTERTDGGTYMCSLMGRDGESIDGSTRAVSLTINFPPGPVHCLLLHSESESWVVLQCAAKGGSPPGEIICLQNGKVAHWDRDVSETNATHIIRTFCITKMIHESVVCCSKNVVRHNSHNCHDVQVQLQTDKNKLSSTQGSTVLSNSAPSKDNLFSQPTIHTPYVLGVTTATSESQNTTWVTPTPIAISMTLSALLLGIACVIIWFRKKICYHHTEDRRAWKKQEDMKTYEDDNPSRVPRYPPTTQDPEVTYNSNDKLDGSQLKGDIDDANALQEKLCDEEEEEQQLLSPGDVNHPNNEIDGEIECSQSKAPGGPQTPDSTARQPPETTDPSHV